MPILMAFLAQSAPGQGWTGNRSGPKEFLNPWVSGPNVASLGSIAGITVPPGYRLLDEAGARAFLERSGNPVPKGLIGILAPQSDQWWAVLAFTSVGYLKDADKEPLDPVAILQAMRKRIEQENPGAMKQGRASVASVDWKELPSYDSATHSLGWAVEAETQSTQTINNTVLIFGRSGVLEITAVQPYRAGADLPPVMQLARNITFKEGQRYADYQSGDKVARISLLGLIVDDEHLKAWTASSGPSFAAWVFYSLIGCFAGGGAVLYLKVRLRSVPRAIHSEGGHEPAAEATPVQSTGLSNADDGSIALKPGAQKIRSNGNNGSKAGKSDRRGRKMAFDYAKFYTDFVMNTEFVMKPGIVAPVHSNGMGSLASNGHNGGSETAPSLQAGPNMGVATASLAELIANQKALINEQMQLIQEQTRFIEEKKKFIKDQNELLERQSPEFANQYSLKLD